MRCAAPLPVSVSAAAEAAPAAAAQATAAADDDDDEELAVAALEVWSSAGSTAAGCDAPMCTMELAAVRLTTSSVSLRPCSMRAQSAAEGGAALVGVVISTPDNQRHDDVASVTKAEVTLQITEVFRVLRLVSQVDRIRKHFLSYTTLTPR